MVPSTFLTKFKLTRQPLGANITSINKKKQQANGATADAAVEGYRWLEMHIFSFI